MLLRQICEVKNNEITIHLPDTFSHSTRVMVTVDDTIKSKSDKLDLLRFAAADPLFLADIKEVGDDFQTTDLDAA